MDEINVYLLAGGESRRMGVNKALLELEGEPAVMRALRVALTVSSRVFLSAVDEAPFRRAGIELPAVPDLVPGQGPLGAIVSCLGASEGAANLFLPCDLPFLHESVLATLVSSYRGEPALCLRSPAGLEPLVGIYHRRSLSVMREALEAGRLSLHQLFRTQGWPDLLFPGEAEGRDPAEERPWYFNLNTPADVARFQELRSHA
jgi:molybdopterin-guanine dinucleotide biosynthesis protein A